MGGCAPPSTRVWPGGARSTTEPLISSPWQMTGTIVRSGGLEVSPGVSTLASLSRSMLMVAERGVVRWLMLEEQAEAKAFAVCIGRKWEQDGARRCSCVHFEHVAYDTC